MSVGPLSNFLSTENLNQTFSIIEREVLTRTNGISISSIPKYKNSFPKMANIIYEKCQASKEAPSITELNGRLVQNSIATYIKNLAKDGYINTGITGTSPNSNVNNYLPAPKIAPSQNNTVYSKSLIPGVNQIPQFELKGRTASNNNNMNTRNDLSEDVNILMSATGDTMYQNVRDLESRDKVDPMLYLNQFSQQREQDIFMSAPVQKQASDNILSMNELKFFNPVNSPIITPSQMSYMENLVDKKVKQIEEDVVADNKIPYVDTALANRMAVEMQKIQRETQPKYIEKVHYITVNSADREWDILAENRYQFQVKFNQKYDPNNRQPGTQITQIFRNILSVELVMAIMPLETYIEPFDTRLYFNISKYPYLLLKIDELDNVFRGTNSENDGAFSMLIYDKTFFTEVLSSGYAVNPSATSNGIVNSYPPVSFSNEFKRGYIKYQPVYFEKKKFYNNPLASLSRMSIHITDHRGYDFNGQSDVLTINTIEFTGVLSGLTTTDYEIDPQFGFPYTNFSGTKMIEITPTSNVSNRLFRIGDRLLIRNHTRTGDTAGFTSFINREEGHVIVNLSKEIDTATGNKSFVPKLYISPPGTMNSTNGGITGYYDDTNSGATSTGGVLLNSDLQCNLMFRIITRDVDTPLLTKPINA
jgi:hypothetical protein